MVYETSFSEQCRQIVSPDCKLESETIQSITLQRAFAAFCGDTNSIQIFTLKGELFLQGIRYGLSCHNLCCVTLHFDVTEVSVTGKPRRERRRMEESDAVFLSQPSTLLLRI
jgi:hypothetical protein